MLHLRSKCNGRWLVDNFAKKQSIFHNIKKKKTYCAFLWLAVGCWAVMWAVVLSVLLKAMGQKEHLWKTSQCLSWIWAFSIPSDMNTTPQWMHLLKHFTLVTKNKTKKVFCKFIPKSNTFQKSLYWTGCRTECKHVVFMRLVLSMWDNIFQMISSW